MIDQTLFDRGYCGYCAAPMEDWQKGHVAYCKQLAKRVKDDKDPVVQLKRIADALERKASRV